MAISIENFERQTMNEDFMLTDIVDFVEVFAPIFEKYFNSMNSISPETKREMTPEAILEEIEQYEDGIRW